MLIRTILLLALCTPVQAKIYRWVDENGQLHYTATPPITALAAHDTREISASLNINRGFGSPSTRVPKTRPRSSRPPERVPGDAFSARIRAREAKCEKLVEKRRRVESKMRAGYTEPQGRELTERKRALSRRIRNECR